MIYFRVDSNSIIASGHVMRCLSIADECRTCGIDCEFLIADKNPIQMIERAGFSYEVLNSKWDDLEQEIHKVKDILKETEKPLLIIDTYYVTAHYIENLLPVAKVCYLGSKKENLGALSALINYSTDVDYTFYKQTYDLKTKLLLGPGYAPLRKEFYQVDHVLTPEIRHILLTTGNTDPQNMVGMILKELIELSFFDELTIDVVVGNMFQNNDILFDNFKEDNILFHQHVTSMSNLMKHSDLAISANGTTVYELVASHVPAITFAMVREQEASAEALEKLGVVTYCGSSYINHKKCIQKIVDKIKQYYIHPDIRILQEKRASQIIGGDGCRKIVEELKLIMD